MNYAKKSLAALLLAFMASAVLLGCSSTDEAAQPEDTSGGVPCEIDMMQEGCSRDDVDL